MTTIAANLDGMAADGFMSDGSLTKKLMRGPGCIVGFAGDAYGGRALASWWVEGRRGPPPDQSDVDRDSRAELLVLSRSGLACVNYQGMVMELIGPYAVIGSGGDLALGAMLAGMSPEEAVAIACQRDAMSKLPVHYEALGRRRK
jgi:ATP-dependent protease HslVU (ClpYQ) peptidase subunit